MNQEWSEYLDKFHRDRAGITESTLGVARSEGISPYQWLLRPLPPDGRVLDLACGSGPLSEVVGARWIGADRSAGELALAGRRGAGRLVRAEAEHLPLAGGSCSAVICSMALMVLEPLDAVLAEVARVLIPSGLALIMVPGSVPLTARDLARYARLMVALRQTHLPYPNDGALVRLRARAHRTGLAVVEDRRRRFALGLPDPAAGRAFVGSLYLPGVTDRRVAAAADVAGRWAGSEIGIPLRRIILRRQEAGRRPTRRRR